MHLNLETFKSNLEPISTEESPYSDGLFRAIDAAHNYTKSSSVDWGSFTLQEAKQALDHALGYVDSEAVDDIDLSGMESWSEERKRMATFPNEKNAIHQFLHSCEAILKLKKIPPLPIDEGDFF
ncbi:hypothetical protein [Paenibacillus sp. MMO-58]|uniref:hypothetical protein n=1 Tax=Paenibacillus sp. MMO-58 TaxID=3081290 RepID=UPI003019F253